MRMIPHYLFVRCKKNGPSVPKCMSKSSLTLTNFIEKYIKICNVKLVLLKITIKYIFTVYLFDVLGVNIFLSELRQS